MLLLQESIFVKIISKIDKGSNLLNWVFKKFFNQITVSYNITNYSSWTLEPETPFSLISYFFLKVSDRAKHDG